MQKRGGNTRPKGGFTIIEVLIVLTVSSVLFMTAMLLIGGQQRKTEFNVGSRNIQSDLSLIINEVATGYYDRSGDLKCTVDNSPNVTFATDTNEEQGASSGCIYLGSAVTFGGDDTTTYRVVPLAGARQTLGEDVKTYEEAKVAPITQLESTKKLPAGFSYVGAKLETSPAIAIDSNSGFTVFFANTLNPGESRQSQQTELRRTTTIVSHPVTTITIDKNILDEVNVSGEKFPVINNLVLCFQGDTDQFVDILFSNGSTEPTYQIKATNTCTTQP